MWRASRAPPPPAPSFLLFVTRPLLDPCKAAMKRIENASSRHLTFCSRRLALLKKARELSALCDAQVALIGFSSSGSSLFEYAGPRSMQEILQAYFDTHRGAEATMAAACSFPSHNSEAMDRLKEDQMQQLEQEERRDEDMNDLKFFCIEQLEKLESELANELTRVRQKKEILIAEQRQELLKKEQELRRENELLTRELMKRAIYDGASDAAETEGSDEDTMSSLESGLQVLIQEEMD